MNREVRQKGQGECFGDCELNELQFKRIASVMALEPATFATLSRADFR